MNQLAWIGHFWLLTSTPPVATAQAGGQNTEDIASITTKAESVVIAESKLYTLDSRLGALRAYPNTQELLY